MVGQTGKAGRGAGFAGPIRLPGLPGGLAVAAGFPAPDHRLRYRRVALRPWGSGCVKERALRRVVLAASRIILRFIRPAVGALGASRRRGSRSSARGWRGGRGGLAGLPCLCSHIGAKTVFYQLIRAILSMFFNGLCDLSAGLPGCDAWSAGRFSSRRGVRSMNGALSPDCGRFMPMKSGACRDCLALAQNRLAASGGVGRRSGVAARSVDWRSALNFGRDKNRGFGQFCL